MLGAFATIFHRMLDRIDAGLVAGSLAARLPDGRERLLGGRAPGPAAVVDLRSWNALLRLATGGSAGWYVAWSKGEWASADPVALFDLFMRNRTTLGGAARAGGVLRGLARLRNRWRRNSREGARRNIEFHYDLGNDFYALWLDLSLTYSSALFEEPVSPGQSLEAAQARKNDAILDRLEVSAGDTVLEIGCGWGAFAESAARRGLGVHAITLSAEQEQAVAARVSAAGLTGVTVSRTDYRDVAGTYDAVASIEMVEAVGQDYWPAYLAAIAHALKPGGRAAIQYIAIDDAIFGDYAGGVDFIQRFVFPRRDAAVGKPLPRAGGGGGAGMARPTDVRAALCRDVATLARGIRRGGCRRAVAGAVRPAFHRLVALLPDVLRRRFSRRRYRRRAGHAGEARLVHPLEMPGREILDQQRDDAVRLPPTAPSPTWGPRPG